MRINSNFHDYYDSVMGAGVDLTMVWHRHPKTEKLEYPFPVFNLRGGCDNLNLGTFAVGFCGKVYLGLQLFYAEQPYYTASEQRKQTSYCYSIDHVVDYVLKHLTPNQIHEFGTPLPFYSNWIWSDKFCKQRVQKYFEWIDDKQQQYQKYFDTAPIFIARHDPGSREGVITYNDKLGNVGFARVFDTYQTYQEIFMYLANKAEPRKPIPHISDEIMLEAKGFDKKTSFRKPKSKK